MIIKFAPKHARIIWTFDNFEDLKGNRKDWNFMRGVWASDKLGPCEIDSTGNSISIVPPAYWEFDVPIRFEYRSDELYHYEEDDQVWTAVRTDTSTHAFLVGNWKDRSATGAFIAALPKPKKA